MKPKTTAAFLLSAVFFFGLGYLVHRNQWLPESFRKELRALQRNLADGGRTQERPPGAMDTQVGEWYPFVPPRSAFQATQDAQGVTREELEALGYLTASQTAPPHEGVTVHDTASAYPGLNLYISGHAPEAYLIDMQGRQLHRWAHDFQDLWPNYEPPDFMRATGHEYWRRVRLFENGDLLALHEGIGIIKLDKDSKLLWSYRGGCHHDFFVTDTGDIYTLTRKAEIVPRINPDTLILHPSVSVLDAEGNEKSRVSLLQCFENSKYAPMLNRLTPSGDLFHTNSIEVFDGTHAHRSPLFAKGKILISIWTLDAIAILNIETKTVEWASTGMWRRQHDPTLLDNGRILLFDNRGNAGQSQILEFDPFSQEIAWTHRGTQTESFFTLWCGAVARLPNGNTLITETNNGRAFEVTLDNRIVWEFINPHQVQREGMTLISSLWEVIRLHPEFGRQWWATP